MIMLHMGGTRRRLTIDTVPGTDADETVRARAVIGAASGAVQHAVERFVAAADDQLLRLPRAATLEAFIALLARQGDAVSSMTEPQLAATWLEAERASGTLEDNRAMIQMLAVELPGAVRGRLPQIGIGPSQYSGKSPGEWNRVAAEAARANAAVLPRREVWPILERLVALHGGKLEFPFIAQLEGFVADIAALGDSAAALSDDEIQQRWQSHRDAT